MERLTSGVRVREPYAVIIFGWLGCSSEKLALYDNLHRNLGARLVLMIHCTIAELLDPWFVRSSIDANLEELPPHTPIVAHVFGNGGMLLYRSVFVGHLAAASRVSAVVFDSTPGKWFTPAILAGFSKSSSKPLVHRLVAFLPLVCFPALLLRLLARRHLRAFLLTILPLLGAWEGSLSVNKTYLECCVNDPVCAPALYLYSSTDGLVDPCVVERLVSERRRMLNKGFVSALALVIAKKHVRSRCWEDSAHVNHYSTHPKEYRYEVESLLREVLPKPKQRVPRVASLPALAEQFVH